MNFAGEGPKCTVAVNAGIIVGNSLDSFRQTIVGIGLDPVRNVTIKRVMERSGARSLHKKVELLPGTCSEDPLSFKVNH